MRGLFIVSVIVCGLLGAVHEAVTFAQYDEASPDAIWFAGTGVALILLAALNWAAWGVRHPSVHVRRAVLLIDAGMAVFGFVAVRAIQEPQAFILLGTFIGMLVSGAVIEWKERES